METLPNYFQTNLQSFSETIIGSACFQTLAPTPTIYSLKDAFQHDWKYQFLYAFPPSSMIGRVLRKVKKKRQTNMIMVIFARNSQSWYPVLFKMIMKSPGLLPDDPKFLLSPEGESHPLIQNLSLTLAAWLVSCKIYLQRNIRKGYRLYLKCLKNRVSVK